MAGRLEAGGTIPPSPAPGRRDAGATHAALPLMAREIVGQRWAGEMPAVRGIVFAFGASIGSGKAMSRQDAGATRLPLARPCRQDAGATKRNAAGDELILACADRRPGLRVSRLPSFLWKMVPGAVDGCRLAVGQMEIWPEEG